MDAMGPLIILLLGLSSPALADLRAFHFVDLPKTWGEAQSYCRERFDDVVTVENEEDWARVIRIVENSGQEALWIGLYDDLTDWRWSLDNTSFYDRTYGSWFIFNEGAGEHCLALSQGEFYEHPCSNGRYFVCYDETSDSYFQVDKALTWEAARTYCRETHTDLASIRDQAEFNSVMNTAYYGYYEWMGLSREVWKWSDLRQSSFRAWKSGQPSGGNEACASATVDGWISELCQQTLPFICEGPPRWRKVTKVKLQTDGLVDLNDPLVQEAVLKKMREDVRQGVHQDFIMKWRKQPHGDVFNKTEL